MLVRRVEPTLPACKQLRKGDVLLSFDGTQIGNDGTVAFRSGERINFSYLVSEKQNHEDVRAVPLTRLALVRDFIQHPVASQCRLVCLSAINNTRKHSQMSQMDVLGGCSSRILLNAWTATLNPLDPVVA